VHEERSIETLTRVLPSLASSFFVVKLALRRKVTPLGKFVRSGVLFAEKIP